MTPQSLIFVEYTVKKRISNSNSWNFYTQLKTPTQDVFHWRDSEVLIIFESLGHFLSKIRMKVSLFNFISSSLSWPATMSRFAKK